jgi:hypothetical protein
MYVFKFYFELGRKELLVTICSEVPLSFLKGTETPSVLRTYDFDFVQD